VVSLRSLSQLHGFVNIVINVPKVLSFWVVDFAVRNPCQPEHWRRRAHSAILNWNGSEDRPPGTVYNKATFHDPCRTWQKMV